MIEGGAVKVGRGGAVGVRVEREIKVKVILPFFFHYNIISHHVMTNSLVTT